MHQNIIKHFLDTNLELILEKSLINCHCLGLDSILFDDTPGARIRIFVANENHELWKNNVYDSGDVLFPLSVAIHPHHCDLTLEVVSGEIINSVFGKDEKYSKPFGKYLYSSKISNNQCKFTNLGKENLHFRYNSWLKEGESESLLASDLHTLWVEYEKEAAWFVFEGKEDVNYKPICYSTADLTKFDDSKLYKKMDKDYLMNTLKKIWPEL